MKIKKLLNLFRSLIQLLMTIGQSTKKISKSGSRKLRALATRKVSKKPINSDPSWLKNTLNELGVKEIKGSGNNPRVLEYHRYTAYKATKDSVSWCSAFMCWAFETVGTRSPRSAAARDWLKWGYPMDKPARGCVVVFWRGSPTSWKGHVGLYIKESKHYIYVLGGNQSDEVNISKYKKSKLLGYRWPGEVKA